MHGIWESKERRAQFWQEMNELLLRFPELMNGMDEAYENCPEPHEEADYDPETMKFFSGMTLILGCANMDGAESMIVLDPFEQSRYITMGLIRAATMTY